jgi:CMP-N,N'-diacetyllegionaminic acid synthase
MFLDKTILAIIPARGGSKGLPGKNIRPLSGVPLIAWSIRAARKSRHIDTIAVSTDDPGIAEIARSYGAEVPFLRPGRLATDAAKSMDVVIHCIDWYEKQGQPFSIVILLQPTSPLRTASDIDAAIGYLFSRDAQAVVSVCEDHHHPLWSNSLPDDLSMGGFIRPEVRGKTRQELPTCYRVNGALYLASTAYLRQSPDFIGAATKAFIMPAERSIDIDNEMDFAMAELLIAREAALKNTSDE